MRTMVLLFVTTCLSFAMFAAARPGIWYRADGTLLIGSTTLTCHDFSLTPYGSVQVSCGVCSCSGAGVKPVVSAKGLVNAKFDHTMSSISVQGTRYNIPGTFQRPMCDGDDIKAFKIRCGSSNEIVFLHPQRDYVCTETFVKTSSALKC